MEEEDLKSSKKRAKPDSAIPQPPRPTLVIPPMFGARRVSFYGDPNIIYTSENEKKRAEIRSMMGTWKHYFAALDAYRSIEEYAKTSDDYRGMRECHQKIGEGYGEIHQLAIESYFAALECCKKIPSQEMTTLDRQAIAQIFSALIKAANGLASLWLANIDQMEKFLVFYLRNFEFLNEAQPTFLSLAGIDWNKLSARVNAWATDAVTARTHIAVIKMFGEEAGRYSLALENEIEKLKKIWIEEVKKKGREEKFSLLHFALEVRETPLFKEKAAAKIREEEARMHRSSQKSSQSPRK